MLKETRKIIQNKYITLAGLIENRVKLNNAARVMKSMMLGWGANNNYNAASNGRIWLIWHVAWYTVKLIRAEDQLIHCKVRKPDAILSVI